MEDDLKKLIPDAPISFGLVNQGHIPAIERILSERHPHPFEKIGKEIGWCPVTAAEYYLRYVKDQHKQETEALRRERDGLRECLGIMAAESKVLFEMLEHEYEISDCGFSLTDDAVLEHRKNQEKARALLEESK